MKAKRIDPKKSAVVIERLGGTSRVAQIFKISPPSVSEWKSLGIPVYRFEYLRLRFRKPLKGISAEDI